MITDAELIKRFGYHPASDTIADKLTQIRAECLLAARSLILHTPEGREQSLAITKLEEAMMWAIAAVVREQPLAP